MRRHGALTLGCGLLTVALAGCGSSSGSTTSPSVTPSSTPSANASPTNAPTTPAPTASVSTASAGASGPKSAGCVNGWIDPAPGDDFYKQATNALQQSQGGTGYTVHSVRYFAGPLAGGGLGAVYYLDLRDPRLSARVLLVSGGGAAKAAVAPTGTTGWKAGDWTGFAGEEPAAVHAPLPGRWSGPEFDPVSGPGALLTPSLAGCMEGT